MIYSSVRHGIPDTTLISRAAVRANVMIYSSVRHGIQDTWMVSPPRGALCRLPKSVSLLLFKKKKIKRGWLLRN